MEKIYLNLKKTDSCSDNGGHRTSDGWVHSFSIDTLYSLTSNSKEAKIPIAACKIFDRLFAKYTNSHESDNDRYYNVEAYIHTCNIDISEFIKELNDVQCKYEFIQATESLEFDVQILIFNSRREENKANQIINECNAQLARQIHVLQEKNKQEILDKIYPHVRNIILEDQLDFVSKYEKVESYPLDLLAIHQEYDHLVASILKYHNPPYEKFSKVYTLLTTGRFSYFDILNGTVPQLKKDENIILSEFLREMERRYRHDSYQSIMSSFPHSPSYFNGLCNLFGHLITVIGVDKCYEMIDWWEYSELPENERSVFSFHARYLFPYFIIVLLAEKEDLTETSFFEKYRYKSGFDDIPFILDRHGIYFPHLIPYFKQILQNSNATEILSLILHRSNIEQYDQGRIRNRELLSCKSNKDKCVEFVKKTLQDFTHNE
ncbi:MAG: hypothetical protein HDR97_00610 [Bacteroides sp.]|nr:hypothetical protein [Bacteroides sp.]